MDAEEDPINLIGFGYVSFFGLLKQLIWMMLILLVVGGVLLEIGTAASKFLFGMGLVRGYAWILVSAGLLKACISIGCLIPLRMLISGEPAPDWATIFPMGTMFVQVLIFGIILPVRVQSLTAVPWSDLVSAGIGRPAAMVLPPTLYAISFACMIPVDTVLTLVAGILTTSAIGGVTVIFILLRPAERERVLGRIWRRSLRASRNDLESNTRGN